jgi:inosine/xanthosine triphosphatase
MPPILIAVGSTRRPKLEAVRDAFSALILARGGNTTFEIVPIHAPSGVGHTPLSRKEMMAGARHRVAALMEIARERHAAWKYFVGLEGGLDIIRENSERRVFLENWACVADETGRAFLGRSAGILLPEPLVKRVVDDGVELSEAIDIFAGAEGVRDKQGAWGVLTNSVITRQDAFRTAVIAAFAPFFNPAFSDPSSPGAH